MKLVFPAETVKLKDGILPHQEIKEWEFQTSQGGFVLLKHPKLKYTLGVKEVDIERDALNGE
jgi:hypothetical protein